MNRKKKYARKMEKQNKTGQNNGKECMECEGNEHISWLSCAMPARCRAGSAGGGETFNRWTNTNKRLDKENFHWRDQWSARLWMKLCACVWKSSLLAICCAYVHLSVIARSGRKQAQKDKGSQQNDRQQNDRHRIKNNNRQIEWHKSDARVRFKIDSYK